MEQTIRRGGSRPGALGFASTTTPAPGLPSSAAGIAFTRSSDRPGAVRASVS